MHKSLSVLCLIMFIVCGDLCLAADKPIHKIDPSDVIHLAFGKITEASGTVKPDWRDPHQVSAYAVGMCRQGKTKELMKEMMHVQEDPELGKALLSFVSEFGPDLERYQAKALYLRFHGYSLSKDTSTWYYWLTDRTGEKLKDSPWVSSRRSIKSHRCALTGIFLSDPNIKDAPGPMPKGLIGLLGNGE